MQQPRLNTLSLRERVFSRRCFIVAIPQIYRDKIASSVVGTPGVDPSAQAIGQGVSSGLETTANASFNIAIDKQNLRNEGEYASLMVQHSLNIMGAAENIKKQYANDPNGMAPALSKAIDNSIDQVSNQASNPYVKLMAQKGDPSAQMWAMRQISQDAYEQGFRNTLVHATETINTLGQQAEKIGGNLSLSPDDMIKQTAPLFHTLGQLFTSVDSSAHQQVADETSTKGAFSIIKSLIDPAIESQPVKAAQLLQNPEVQKLMPADELKKYQDSANAAIANFPKKMLTMQIQQDFSTHPQLVTAAMNGQMTYAQVDRQQRMDTEGLHEHTYNYLKDIILGAGRESDIKDVARQKAQIIDDASKLGIRLKDDPTDLAQTGADKKAQISSNVRDLYKLQDEILDGQRRGVLSKEESGALYSHLYVPMVAATMKNHDPHWYDGLVNGSMDMANGAANFFSGKKGLPEQVGEFNSAYHVIENYLKLPGGQQMVQDAGGEYEAKSRLYENYFTQIDATKGKNMPNSNQPWTPRESAYYTLGIQADGKNTYDFGSYGRRVITGHDADGSPLFHSSKEDDEKYANQKNLAALAKQGTP